MNTFSKKITALALAATVMTGTVAATATPAAAGGWHHWNHHWNGPLAGGIVGGLLLGSIIAANAQQGSCYLQRQPIYNEFGEVIAIRKVRVCD